MSTSPRNVVPTSNAEVVALIQEARRDRRPLWFRGSGTAPAPEDHTVVSTEKLTGIVDYRPDDLTVVVRAGTTLKELDETLSEHCHSAMLPETVLNRTVGGIVATGASGYRRRRYGPTSDRVIGATIVTGYGEVVSAGGQLVKNVTGYDIPRLVTGSHGALGFIAEISLKLWPEDSEPRTMRVEDPGEVAARLYQPIAALETESGGFVYVSGPGEPALDGATTAGFEWPDPIDDSVVVTVNIAPRFLSEAIGRVRSLGAARFVAQHGVGVLDVSWAQATQDQMSSLRMWVESSSGALVVHRHGPLDGSFSKWGRAPESVDIQRRLKDLFDPDRVCNPGVLPGDV